MSVVFERTKLLTDKTFHYCPGCNHGIIHRLVAESIEELEKEGVIEEGKVIGVAPVGCSVFAYDYFNCDMYEAAHGRAPAVATGAKRVVGKDTLVFTYQGDGDLASIGTAEIVHAAHRGEHICTIFVNNAIYGMTGGQMAPTTLVGQKTTTSPKGRDEAWCGAPIRVAEMLSTIPGSYYIERCAVNNNAINPNISAADTPTAHEVNPPVNSPRNPCSSIAFFIPFHKTLPNPVRGTVAPAPANLTNGSYIPTAPSTTPVVTRMTIILPGISFVFSIRICVRTHINPPHTNALTKSMALTLLSFKNYTMGYTRHTFSFIVAYGR